MPNPGTREKQGSHPQALALVQSPEAQRVTLLILE